MPNSLRVFPHAPSNGAKALAEALGTRRIKQTGSRYMGSPGSIVINWGNHFITHNGVLRAMNDGRLLNRPEAVALARNKLHTFRALDRAAVSTVPFTTDIHVANTWLKVVERHSLTGQSGSGIRVVKPAEATLSEAPLYTQYVPKTGEFRAHIIHGELVDIARKGARTSAATGPESRDVWSHNNGYVYIRGDLDERFSRWELDSVKNLAISAVSALGLDFGAVDIIFNRRRSQQTFVLEVNTAPGLEGTTIERYAEAFLSHYGNTTTPVVSTSQRIQIDTREYNA